jgi:hypothetical protein
MNASKLFTAVTAIVFAGSAFAADLPAANAATTSAAAAAAQVSVAAAAQVSVAAKSLNVPAILVNKSAGASRAQVRAEAVEAAKNHRSTEASQFDWFNN